MRKVLTTGDGRVTTVKAIADLYRDVVSLSCPLSGRVNHIENENYGLTCTSKTTDCDTQEIVRTTKSYSLITSGSQDRRIESVRCVSHPQLLSELAVATSISGRFLSRLRGSNEPDGKRQFLEIWDRSKLLKTFDVNELEQHGPICIDPTFGSMSWCPFGEQDKLLYICQAKKPKAQCFFKQHAEKDGEQNSKPLGDDNLRVEDWGECLTGIEHTVIGMIDLAEFKISTIDLPGHSLSGSRWLDENHIVSTAYSEEPRKLALIYCNNRLSKLVVHDLVGSSYDIAIEGKSLHTARVSHSGKKIVYLANPTFGAHKQIVSLSLYDVETRNTVVLAEDLFVLDLPENCFSSDDQNVLFIDYDYFHSQMCLINTETTRLQTIKFPTTGMSILDFRHDIILATGSEPNATPTLYVATLTSPELVAWHQIEDSMHIDELNYQVHKIETTDKTSFASAMLVTPNLRAIYRNFRLEDTGVNEADLPTVVMIHGGPHSAFLVDYFPVLVFLTRLGLKTLRINYRGSSGVDGDYLRSLHGRVGEIDVEDCLQVIRHFAKEKAIDPKKLIIQGGSHGGFIVCHMSCQQEFQFKSAIIQNPVVDISTMHATTDIPDWCYNVALGHEAFKFDWVPSGKELAKMFESSPISRVQSANVPTLMLLGTTDKRVPMFQGERWVDLLKARGIETKCKVYKDKHDLAKPDVDADKMITSLIWILEHLDK